MMLLAYSIAFNAVYDRVYSYLIFTTHTHVGPQMSRLSSTSWRRNGSGSNLLLQLMMMMTMHAHDAMSSSALTKMVATVGLSMYVLG